MEYELIVSYRSIPVVMKLRTLVQPLSSLRPSVNLNKLYSSLTLSVYEWWLCLGNVSQSRNSTQS